MSWIETKYIELMGGRLERFKKASRDTHVFRCPYCGDSDKSKSKTRGYFYTSGNDHWFKCHNCGESKSIRGFIKEIFPDLYKGYLFEQFGDKKKEKSEEDDDSEVAGLFKTASPADRFRNKKTLEEPKPTAASKKVEVVEEERDTIVDAFRPISRCKPDNPGRAYLEGRKIPEKFFDDLYWVPDVNKLFGMLDAYEDVRHRGTFSAVMLAFWSEDKKLMFVQLRYLDDDAPARYKTLEIEGGEKVWGLDRLDKTKTIYVFEGAFDAMFIDNSIGSGGADLLELGQRLIKETGQRVVLVWDADFSSNKEVRARLQDAVNTGMEVILTDKKLEGKDVNDAIKNGWTPEQTVEYLHSRAFSGLEANLELSKFKKPIITKDSNGRRPWKKKNVSLEI